MAAKTTGASTPNSKSDSIYSPTKLASIHYMCMHYACFNLYNKTFELHISTINSLFLVNQKRTVVQWDLIITATDIEVTLK